MTTSHNGNYNSKSFNISHIPSYHSNQSDSRSDTSSIQTLTNYYTAKLSNIKLIYLIFTFFITILGLFVFVEHRLIIYKEFKVLYFYVILSITYWPVSIFLAGILILIKFIKKYFSYNLKDDEDMEDSLMIKFDNLSLTNYNSNNPYYSYIMFFFLFIILGYYIVCIPTSFYIIYNLLNSKIFFLHLNKYFNIFLFVFLSFSKSIAIAISCIYLLLLKYKSNRIKFELDDEFVKKIAEEIEQVKRCSGIFIADLDTIKRNEMFNRHTFNITMPHEMDKKNNFKISERKQNLENNSKEQVNAGSLYEDKHKKLIKQGYYSPNRQDNLEFGISPEKNNKIIPLYIESPNIGDYSNDNNFNFDFNSNQPKDSTNYIINVNNGTQINQTPNSRQPVSMSDQKTRIKNMIRAKTMTGIKKNNLIYNLKKKLHLDTNEKNDKYIVEENSVSADDVSNISDTNSVNKSPLVLHRVSRNLQGLMSLNLADDQELIPDLFDNKIIPSISRDSNLFLKNNLNKYSPPNSKSKDDMELIESHNNIKNEFIVGLATDETSPNQKQSNNFQRALQFTD